MSSFEIVADAAERLRAQRQKTVWRETRQAKQARKEDVPTLVYTCECGSTITCGVSADWRKLVGICPTCGATA
jgi:hypothetical protein